MNINTVSDKVTMYMLYKYNVVINPTLILLLNEDMFARCVF